MPSRAGQHVDQGIGQLDFEADHARGIVGIAKLIRRAPFGVASPAQNAVRQSLARAAITSRECCAMTVQLPRSERNADKK